MCIKKLKSRQTNCSVVEEENETEDNVKQSISGQNNNWIYYLLWSRSNFLLSLITLLLVLHFKTFHLAFFELLKYYFLNKILSVLKNCTIYIYIYTTENILFVKKFL